MSKSFNFEISPVHEDGVVVLEGLQDAVVGHAEKHGFEQCATLGQIKFWLGGQTTIEGRLFTGEALQYLFKHMKVAAEMQDKQE